jgi:oligopeptide/dipeptide ABC transporter ATP-binding protein
MAETVASRAVATHGGNGRKPILEVEGLKTQFFTRAGVVYAVDGVSFSVNEGETVGIVGESGCGKSVTSLSLMRLVPSPPGRIVDGKITFRTDTEEYQILEMPEHEMRKVRGHHMAMIFQDPMTSLNPVLTIGVQLSEPLMLHLGMSKEEARQRAVELMKQVGIPGAEERLDSYPHQYSGGMRQRVMIAIALACNPKLLIADEPTTALDVTIQAQILDLMRKLNEETGTAIIMITHDLGVVAEMCQRVIVMYAGQIIESAPVDELFNRPKHPYTLGLMNSVPRIGEDVKQALTPIGGLPPDLRDPPKGCRFRPRCGRRTAKCEETPPLELMGQDHLAACWHPVEHT